MGFYESTCAAKSRDEHTHSGPQSIAAIAEVENVLPGLHIGLVWPQAVHEKLCASLLSPLSSRIIPMTSCDSLQRLLTGSRYEAPNIGRLTKATCRPQR